ncbi:hypothetical protein K2X33_12055 [bacterium]|nr:hypothetical protein [bacterium]
MVRLAILFSVLNAFAAWADFIKPADYTLSCKIDINDVEAGTKFQKSSLSDKPADWPIQIDLAKYPDMNDKWFAPVLVKQGSFQIRYWTGRDTQFLELGDYRKKPASEFDIFHLASSSADLKAERLMLAYTRPLTVWGVPQTTEVFAQCALLKK